MCLILFGWNVHPRYSLVVASNRDEFYDRPTEPLNWWNDNPNILGGRDKAKVNGSSGTWMGISKTGRFAAITNIRAPSEKNGNLKTRGEITNKFLTSSKSLSNFESDEEINYLDYNGFNLLTGNLIDENLSWTSNRYLENSIIYPHQKPRQMFLKSGVYGLSNAMLDTPWPKVEKSKLRFTQALSTDQGDFDSPERYFDLLYNKETAPSYKLPNTGIDRELEKVLSSAFIKTNNYGTRSSSLLRVRRSGEFEFIENRFDAQGQIDSKTIRDKFI